MIDHATDTRTAFMPPATPPRNVVGEIRSPHRPVWIASAEVPLRCGPPWEQATHALSDHLAWNDACMRCDHQGPSGREDCNHLIFLVGGGLVTPRDKRIYILTRVTIEEVRHMKAQRMDWAASIAYLGIGLLP